MSQSSVDGYCSRVHEARSFPYSVDSRIRRQGLTYTAPSAYYAKWFSNTIAVPPADDEAEHPNRRNAGWLLHEDEESGLYPVFIAHSLITALSTLRDTFPPNIVPPNYWEPLMQYAADFTQDSQPPPSAQRKRKRTDSDADEAQSPTPGDKEAEEESVAGETEQNTEGEEENEDRTKETGEQGNDTEVEETGERNELESQEETRELRMVQTSNNTRRAAKRRSLERRRSLGVVAPSTKAPASERLTYQLVTDEEAQWFSWIFQQPADKDTTTTFRDTARKPYVTAKQMLDKAYAVGNPASQDHAVSFLRSWRAYGTPFLARAPFTPKQAGPELATQQSIASQAPDINFNFRQAYDVVEYFETELAALHIQYRWVMACLGRTYQEKIAILERSHALGRTRSESGRSMRSQATDALFKLLYPNERDKDKRPQFRKRLERAARWYKATQILGWGSLCLVPDEDIPKSWAEQTLRVYEWDIWLQLVKKVRPDVYEASQALEQWLGPDGIAGGPISGKERLCIETKMRTTRPGEINEIQDSEQEDDDEDAAGLFVTQSDSSKEEEESHQLRLPELFQPRGAGLSSG